MYIKIVKKNDMVKKGKNKLVRIAPGQRSAFCPDIMAVTSVLKKKKTRKNHTTLPTPILVRLLNTIATIIQLLCSNIYI